MLNSYLQKFYPLPGRQKWPTAQASHIVDSLSGLCLQADPAGPLSLASSDGSLGGLAMPQGMAFDPDGMFYLLDRVHQRIRRFEPQLEPKQSEFVDVEAFGGMGPDARQFTDAANLAINGCDLYVVDPGARRVQVFAIHPAWPLRQVWDAWEPVVR